MFLSKMFTNGINMFFFYYKPEAKSQPIKWKHWFSDKEKVLGAAVSKEGHADNILEHERIYHYRFPWKRYDCKQYFPLPAS